MAVKTNVIRPQPGPQEVFLASPADIAIYGGAAGGGKTWGLLMESLRNVKNPQYGAVFFRRSTVQIRNEGGLWDESANLFPDAGGRPREHVLDWKFKSGATISFAHLEHDKTRLNWQGSQIPLICFDELTHFSEIQFWYMLSRNRSMCGVRPYVRATCNPDVDSWVANFIAWWIDQNTGLPIPERAGVVRWMVRIGDKIAWADSPQELAHHTMPDENGDMVPIPPKSVTFIAASVTDNKALMAADPAYIANLMALPTVERERLMGGNWKIRPSAGLYFQRAWCEVIDVLPLNVYWCRGWDLAATIKTENNDPDSTSSTKIGVVDVGGVPKYIVAHNTNDQKSPAGVRELIQSTAEDDNRNGEDVMISIPQDPGQAGKAQKESMAAQMTGYNVRFSLESGDKVTRFSPFSAQAQAGNVMILRGSWNDSWFNSLEGFPEAAHDDDPDSTARAFNALNEPQAQAGVLLAKRNR